MTEFERINAFFQTGYPRHSFTHIANGDDASQIAPPSAQHTLVQSIDTQVAGVHFPTHANAGDIAERSLRCALSDIIAMGARPTMMHLALTLTQAQDERWLDAFARGLKTCAHTFDLELLGGDTTSGTQLTISWHVQGWLDRPALCRSGACVGDDVWLSQTPAGLGAAHLALPFVLGEKPITQKKEQAWVEQYYRPVLYPALGEALIDNASACLDVSDGLVQDAGHIARQSQVDLHLDAGAIRTSVEPSHPSWRQCFNGGDDYQLLFCAPKTLRSQIEEHVARLPCAPQRIGHCAEAAHTPCVSLYHNRQKLVVQDGYQHS